LGVLAEDRLLAHIFLMRVEGRGDVALQHIRGGGIDVGEVRAEGPTETVIEAIRGDYQESRA
jgi:hypothetical protein